MSLPRVLLCSMWKNDGTRQIVDRVEHLLAKAETYAALRWLWVVGDSIDDTAATLRALSVGYDVTILDIGSTGIEGDDMGNRLRRLSVTGNHYSRYAAGADYILVHESDILSPGNIVNLLVANAERGICPVAAWPMLEIRPGHKVLYDVWAYCKNGVRFTSMPPYHQAYQADRPFVVDSFGTVFLFHAEDAPSAQMGKHAVLDLCWHLREQGRTLWVDPRIVVEQPISLWAYAQIPEEYA